MKNDDRKPTTTDAGIPVSSDEYSLTVGPDGPILLQDHIHQDVKETPLRFRNIWVRELE